MKLKENMLDEIFDVALDAYNQIVDSDYLLLCGNKEIWLGLIRNHIDYPDSKVVYLINTMLIRLYRERKILVNITDNVSEYMYILNDLIKGNLYED